MSTHVTRRRLRSTRTGTLPPDSAEPTARNSADPSSWSAATLQALAHASALGLLIPPSTWHTPGDRQDGR